MDSWRNDVIKQFSNQSISFFIVNDPDYFLSDENVLKYFAENGYNVIRFDDSVSFRFLYESQYRKPLGNNEIKVLLYSNDEEKDVFSYDLLRQANYIYLSINSLFPKFSPTIVKQLDKEDLDSLYTLQKQYQGSKSDTDTLKFILKHICRIVPELIDSKEEFYKLLFSIHYGKREIPEIIKEYLINQLLSKTGLYSLSVIKLINSPEYFYQFIDMEWSKFIKELVEVSQNAILEETEIYQTHPFTNTDIRRLMDDLFLEGFLHKVKLSNKTQLPKWMKFGIEQDKEDRNEDLLALHKKVLDSITKISRYKDWYIVAELYADYKIAVLHSKQARFIKDSNHLSRTINEKFEKWLLSNYHSISSLPPFPKPKMLHHIVHNLATNHVKSTGNKSALIVLDGMSFMQWKKIKKYLDGKGFSFEGNAVYAWVPTLTSISRQTIFSGQIPMMFSNHLQTTSKEESHWKMFWEDHGVLKQYVEFQKGLGKEDYDKSNISAFKRPNIKVYGAVVDVIDGFVHGATQGEKSIMAELDIWLETGYLYNLLKDLTKENFSVYLTSDHGNTESIGIGRISEGVLVDQKGERVRVYTDNVIYNQSAEQIDSIKWKSIGLPDGYHVLLAKYGEAFVNKNERIVSHGGISIEEVIVPFVKVIPGLKED